MQRIVLTAEELKWAFDTANTRIDESGRMNYNIDILIEKHEDGIIQIMDGDKVIADNTTLNNVDVNRVMCFLLKHDLNGNKFLMHRDYEVTIENRTSNGGGRTTGMQWQLDFACRGEHEATYSYYTREEAEKDIEFLRLCGMSLEEV